MVPNILLKVPFLALAFFTLTTQAQSTCSPLSGEFVFVPPTLPIAGNCNGSYFQISIGEGATSYEGNAIKDVNIIDVTLGEFLVRHLNNDLKEPVYELVTHGNEFLVTWGVLNATATDAFINITYEEIPLTIKDPQQFAYENSTFYYGTLGPNEKQRLDFTGTSEAHLFEVKLDLQRPTSGFLAVETGTGRMGIMARQRADLAIPLAVRGMENMINVTEPGVSNWTYAEMNTTMKVITLNTLDDFQDAQFALGFHLGKKRIIAQ